MPDAERLRRRKDEARSLGLTLKEWMNLRREKGLIPENQPRAKAKTPKLREVYRSDLCLSEEAQAQIERERMLARRHQPKIATIPCPKLRFRDLAAGQMALDRMIIDTPDVWDENLHPYECRRCGGVHLGHSFR